MQLYDLILKGADVPSATNQVLLDAFFEDYCAGIAWGDTPVNEQPTPDHSRHIGEYDDVDVWYCYGEDYFFFQAAPGSVKNG